MSDPEKLAYRAKELVAATGLSKSTIYRLLDSGELPSFKFRGLRMVLRSDVDAWLAKISGGSGRKTPANDDPVRAATAGTGGRFRVQAGKLPRKQCLIDRRCIADIR